MINQHVKQAFSLKIISMNQNLGSNLNKNVLFPREGEKKAIFECYSKINQKGI